MGTAMTTAALAALAHHLLVGRERLMPMPDPQPNPQPNPQPDPQTAATRHLLHVDHSDHPHLHVTTGPVGTGASTSLDGLLDRALEGKCGAITHRGTFCQRRTTTPPCAAHPD